jgi:hypothetical protein
METNPQSQFEKAGEQKQSGLLAEFWFMLKTNKKYWMAPLIISILLLGLLLILGGSAVAPFIYTLF